MDLNAGKDLGFFSIFAENVLYFIIMWFCQMEQKICNHQGKKMSLKSYILKILFVKKQKGLFYKHKHFYDNDNNENTAIKL